MITPFEVKRNQTIVILAVLFFVYFNALVFAHEYFGHFIEIIALAIIAFRMFQVAIRRTIHTEIWVLLSLSVCLWLFGYIFWYIYWFNFNIEHARHDHAHTFYIVPAIFMLSSLVIYTIKCFNANTKNKILLYSDISSVFLMLLLFGVMTYQSFDFTSLSINSMKFSVFISSCISFLILFFALSILFMSSDVMVHVSMVYVVVANIIFALTNINHFSDVLFNDSHINGLFADIPYMIVFFILMLGSYQELYKSRAQYSKNLNFSLMLKYIPALSAIVFVIQNGLESIVSFYVIVVLLVHVLISYYIKAKIDDDAYLQTQKQASLQIEKYIEHYTKEVMLANLKLSEIVDKDYLTSAYSRSYLIDSLNSMLKNLKHDEELVLYHVNLRRFSQANSAYGYGVGDKILKIIAKRLMSLSGDIGVVARLNADDFMFAIKKQVKQDASWHVNLVQRIINSVEESIEVESYRFMLNCVIGYDIARLNDKKQPRDLMRNADKAVSFLKSHVLNSNVLLFTKEIQDLITKESNIAIGLKNARKENRFSLVYQPVVEIRSGKILSIEAFIRYKSDEFGELLAKDFIKIAEKNDLIDDVYDYVLNECAKTILKLKQNNIKCPPISINISSIQYLNANFAIKLRDTMIKNKIPRGSLIAEICENIWMNDEVVIDEIFAILKGSGALIYMDNYGSGYSSIALTRRKNIDAVKISNDLVQNIIFNDSDKIVVKSLIEITKIIGAKSIIKMVDSKQMVDALLELGCEAVQGNAIKSELKEDELIKYLKNLKNVGGGGDTHS